MIKGLSVFRQKTTSRYLNYMLKRVAVYPAKSLLKRKVIFIFQTVRFKAVIKSPL